MAGNKFRNFRNKEKAKEKEKEMTEIERNSNLILVKDYEILSKAKEDEKYYSKIIYKKGTKINVLDTIKNAGMMYLKIPVKKNSLTFGYIALMDNEGNYNIKKSEENKENKKLKKSNIETCGSIRLADAKIGNKENSQKSQEDSNCYKKNDELMMNKVIPFLIGNNINQNEEETKESTDISIPSEPEINTTKENKNDPFYIEDIFSTSESNVKSDTIPNISKAEDIFNNLCYLSNDFMRRNDNVYNVKKNLANNYLLLKGIEKHQPKYCEKKLQNLSLDAKYQKGYQIIYRPLNFSLGNFLYEKVKAGHIFIRYYDKEKGIEKIIESIDNNGINEIKFNDFKIDDLKKFSFYNILQDEELSEEQDFERVKNKIIQKFKNKNGVVSMGRYRKLSNNCFNTVLETLKLMGKSTKVVEKLRKDLEKELLEFLEDNF